MKKIIEGKLYNTATATEICSNSYGNAGDFHHYEETLYRIKKGQFFVAGSGGAASSYRKQVDTNSWSGGSDIRLLDDNQAQEFVARVDTEKALELFGDQIQEG